MHEKKFQDFHENNPHVYELFKAFSLVEIEDGRTHLSAKFIFEMMRREDISTSGDHYKLNNNYTAYYARLFMKDFPQHEGVFQVGKLGSRCSEI